MVPMKKMDPSSSSSSSASPSEEIGTLEQTEMEQVSSDLQSLKTLYGLLHRGSADENASFSKNPIKHLDGTSRAFLMRILDDATQQTLLRQAKMLSGSLMSPALERKLSVQPDRPTRGDAVPGLKPIASFSPGIHASETTRRLRTQCTVRSRSSRHGQDDRLLARVASNRSSTTAVPHHRQSPEQRLASHRSSRAVTPQHGTVAGEHGPPRGSGGGDQSSMERGSSRRRYLSREPSAVQDRGRRLHRGFSAAARRVGAEGSSTTRRLGRLDSGLSVSVVPRHGSQRAGRCAATPKLTSSSEAAVTIRSSIRPNGDIMERSLRRAGEPEEESPRRRRGKGVADDGSASIMGWSSRPRRTLNQINSGSTYSSGGPSRAAASFASWSPTEPSTSGASASSSWLSSRGNAPPEYASYVSGASRSRRRRRRERQERRKGRMRRFKNKLAMVFHHRHDHHHHHHHHHHLGPSGNQEERLSRRHRRFGFLAGVFHRATRHEKTTSVQAKRRGVALFGALPRHVWYTRKPPASAGMWRTGSRLKVKKLHWWQRMSRRRGRRSGHGKAV
ncbi:hypothetical protein E2562_014867 [Oryza meyeriana var. granulata]|uniref:Uncharacterized protein n=1 Tax=Oryza meyeriana var. granulata TaxID=110450 RepID=A0A6G1BWK7_9ORYZ|nr:hypothetical protein E2562_014867 [Oryza meyeriana var. granulata]